MVTVRPLVLGQTDGVGGFSHSKKGGGQFPLLYVSLETVTFIPEPNTGDANELGFIYLVKRSVPGIIMSANSVLLRPYKEGLIITEEETQVQRS